MQSMMEVVLSATHSPSGNHTTVCVAIDLTAAFDTVSHDILISKIAASSLPPAITRLLSWYLRGRQLQLASEVLSRARESSAPVSLKIQVVTFTVRLLHSWYAKADSPGQTGLLRWRNHSMGMGPKMPLLESMIYLKENSLLISATKSTVTLFTPDTHQFQTHPDISL